VTNDAPGHLVLRRSDIEEYQANLRSSHLLVRHLPNSKVLGSRRLGIALKAFGQRKGIDHMLVLSEDIGFVLATLMKISGWQGKLHVVVHAGHGLRRRRFFRWSDGKKVANYIAFSGRQIDVLVEEIGIEPERVHMFFNPVDTKFFNGELASGEAGSGGYVFSCGRENRDYDTLRKAAAKTTIPFLVQATGFFENHAKPEGQSETFETRTERVTFEGLRDLYHQSKFVVLPLNEVDYAAGVTGMVEAMAMGKAVIVSASHGMKEYFESDGVRTVPASDPDALLQAIEELNASPELCAQMGAANREWAVQNCEVSLYARGVAEVMGIT